MNTEPQQHYAGFWIRVGAAFIDSIILLALSLPPLLAIYGWTYFEEETGWIAGWADFLISYVFPAVFTIVFWHWKTATPGKMVLSMKILDADSGTPPTMKQWIIRYLGYFVSLLPVGLGYLWVGWDPRKQAWHDKLARTVVVRETSRRTLPVTFEQESEPGVETQL